MYFLLKFFEFFWKFAHLAAQKVGPIFLLEKFGG